jgi:predicted nucleic acid-binding protein
MPTPPLILDTCVVLSLYATRRMEALLDVLPEPILIAEAVLSESLYVHVLMDDVREKEPIILGPLVDAGKLTVVAPESNEEFEALLDFALVLDDGEAMTCALALHRNLRIATDERKTIRLISDQIEVVGTLDLIRGWAGEVGAPTDEIRDVLTAIADRGYVPGRDHRHWRWWDDHVGSREG